MFRCDACQKISPPRSPMIKIPAITREHVHREHTYYLGRGPEGGRKKIHDPGGKGRQIVRELKLCVVCARGQSVYAEPSEDALSIESVNQLVEDKHYETISGQELAEIFSR